MRVEYKTNITAKTMIELLWQEGFFKVGRTLKEICENITEKWGHNLPPSSVSKAAAGSRFLICTGKRGSFQYKQKISPVSIKIETIEESLFSAELTSKMGRPFTVEIADLHLNFGRSGTCTAFLLRKILEKAICLSFAKNGQETKLEDRSKPGRLIGLEAMIETAAREKINGIPFLQPSTAQHIKGIKFLGDVSAHNAMINVDMETILPQMPFIITAYKELAEKL